MGNLQGQKFIGKIRSETLITLVILLVAALVRLIYSTSRGIWYDDAFSILLSQQSLDQIVAGTAADTMPPLYYFLLHFWMSISSSVFYIRLLNIILGLLVLYVVFCFGKEISGSLTGWTAALLTAFAPIQVYHAQEVRMYIILELSLLVYAWMSWRIFVSGNTRKINWIIIIAGGVGAFYSHNLAIFILIVPDIILILQKQWRSLGKLITAQAVMALLFIPWLLFVPGQIEKIQTAFWTPRPGLVEIFQGIGNLYGFLPQPIIVTAIILILSLQALGMMGLQFWKNRTDRRIKILLAWALIPPILLFITSYLMRPVFVPRAFITSGIFTYLLAGVLAQTTIQEVGRQSFIKSGVIPLLFMLVSLISLPNLYRFDEFPRSPFRQAAGQLAPVCQSDCLVVHDNKLSYFPMVVYQPDLAQAYIRDEPGTHNDSLAIQSQIAMGRMASTSSIEAAGGKQEVYLIVFDRALYEYKELGLEIAPCLKSLQDEYELIDIESVGDLRIYHLKK